MIGASNEQLDVFNEVWYDILMNTGHTAKGKFRFSFSFSKYSFLQNITSTVT